MLSLTSQYALRAMMYLARHETDWPVPGRCIAEEAQIPAKYLSKILGDLVRVGVLESSPGKTGGFRLKRAASETILYDVLLPFEQFDHRQCPFGKGPCDEGNPCPAHHRWKCIVDAQLDFLQKTSIQEISFSNEGNVS